MIRYYRGTIKMEVLQISEKKALVRYLENGKVGSKQLGFKNVEPNNKDITLTRFCYRNKKEGDPK